jgi:LPXTG-motif cell wall-anchored protein
LTVSNTGNTALTNVKPNLEELSGAMSGASAECAALDFGTLKVGESRSLTCETAGITDATKTTVNTAKVEGVPADDAGVALPAFTKPIESNEASAEVLVLAPSVKLVKEVCVTGSKCDPTVAADWKVSSTVKTGSAAVWRLTASNTGNTTLTNVKPSFEELSGAMTGTSAACTALDFGTLAAGESRSLTCETAGITNDKMATVNTAALSGVPSDSAGVPLPQFSGEVKSAKATASVTVASSAKKKENPNKKSDPSKKTNPNTPVNKATSPEAGAKGLAATGGETSALIAAASLLLVGGAGALFARRRRA